MKRLLLILAVMGYAMPAVAATGTITPSPFQVVLDNSGNPINLACVWTYTAGSSTPVATYTDVGLITQNANPIIVGPSGRYTAFLTLGQSYKFVYESPPCSAVSHGAVLVTADNISATPGSSGSTDTLGTAGEALTAGQAVYLSAGDGGKTAGQWFKADSANAYSSTLHAVGIVPTSITSLAIGTIRLAGQVTASGAVVAGSNYYIGTAGAITATAPANSRIIGQADSISSLVVGFIPTVTLSPLNLAEGRLTLTTALPVTTADVTAAATIFYAPYTGSRLALYDGTSAWIVRSFTEITLPLGTLSSGKPYDVFAYDSSGTVALEMLAWTNDTTRATALTTQDGVLVKTGATTRRYLGSFYTTAATTTEDSKLKRYLWNYYNRVPRLVRVQDATDSWAYSLGLRQARGSTANQFDVMVGWSEDTLTTRVTSYGYGDAPNGIMVVGIGEDSVAAIATNSLAPEGRTQVVNIGIILWAELVTVPAVGHHFYAWLEYTNAAANFTWYGDGGTPTLTRSGMLGMFWA